MAGAADNATQLLDVDVQQVPGVRELVAIRWLGRLQVSAGAPTPALRRIRLTVARGRPVVSEISRPTRRFWRSSSTLLRRFSVVRRGRAARPARAVQEPWHALLPVAPQPLGYGPDAQAKGLRRLAAAPALGLDSVD